jgi:hypothetical protein
VATEKQGKKTISTMARMFSYTEVIVTALACCFLFDAIRRLWVTKIENGAICIKMTGLLIFSFLAQLSSSFILQYIRDDILAPWYILSLVSFTCAFSILALFLFMIGVQQSESETCGKTEFERLASEELIKGDWEITKRCSLPAHEEVY